jgi:hypothetical protein
VQERLPRALVGLQRLRPAAGPVERQHQLRVQALAGRVLGHQALELGDEFAGAAGLELRLEPELDRRQALLFELEHELADAGLAVEVGERAAAPERERLPQPLGRAACVLARQRLSGVGHELAEACEVDLLGAGAEQVGARAGLDPIRPQRPPQPGDVHLHRVPRGDGRRLGPERVHEALDRDGLVRPQQELREQGPLLGRAERDRFALDERLEGTEEAEVDVSEAGRRGLVSVTLSVH